MYHRVVRPLSRFPGQNVVGCSDWEGGRTLGTTQVHERHFDEDIVMIVGESDISLFFFSTKDSVRSCEAVIRRWLGCTVDS